VKDLLRAHPQTNWLNSSLLQGTSKCDVLINESLRPWNEGLVENNLLPLRRDENRPQRHSPMGFIEEPNLSPSHPISLGLKIASILGSYGSWYGGVLAGPASSPAQISEIRRLVQDSPALRLVEGGGFLGETILPNSRIMALLPAARGTSHFSARVPRAGAIITDGLNLEGHSLRDLWIEAWTMGLLDAAARVSDWRILSDLVRSFEGWYVSTILSRQPVPEVPSNFFVLKVIEALDFQRDFEATKRARLANAGLGSQGSASEDFIEASSQG
jgi:hypothetical protein